MKPSSSFGGTYVQTQKSPLMMTPQEFHAFVSRNVPGNPNPTRLTVIEVPERGVRIDPSVLVPEPGTGHLPPKTPMARIIAEYEITYDVNDVPSFRRIEGSK